MRKGTVAKVPMRMIDGRAIYVWVSARIEY